MGGGRVINNSDDTLHCDLRTGALLNAMMFEFICCDEMLINTRHNIHKFLFLMTK